MQMRLAAQISLLLMSPSLALAASAGGEPSIAEVGPQALNFLIYLGIFYLILRKPLPKAMRNRKALVEEGIADASKEAHAAQAILSDAQAKVINLDSEMIEAKAAIAKETKKEAAALVEDAKRRAVQILERAKVSAAAEQRATERVLREELADMVVKLAKEKIQAELDSNADKQLRQSSLHNIAALNR